MKSTNESRRKPSWTNEMSPIIHEVSSIIYPLSSTKCHPSSILYPPPNVIHRLSSILHQMSSIIILHHPSNVIHHPWDHFHSVPQGYEENKARSEEASFILHPPWAFVLLHYGRWDDDGGWMTWWRLISNGMFCRQQSDGLWSSTPSDEKCRGQILDER